ncbi:uncharacterized protein [Eurosta solidaginis]|uniref:uncharacterized protein isoform X2 n=1 Tax=Eurosta solidaginis TaxID=178769 RepID=UPI0035307C06
MAEAKKWRSEIRNLSDTISELSGQIKELKNTAVEKNHAIESLKSEINANKDTYNLNLESIKSILAEQTILIQTLSENMYPVPKFSSMFPIKTQPELDVLEAFICAENQNQMVGTVFQFIKSGGFKQNLLSILGEDIILQHNMDGKQGKTPILRYAKLMKVLFAAHKLGIGEKECKDQLRQAMKAVKNRYHKASCLKRKHTEATPE